MFDLMENTEIRAHHKQSKQIGRREKHEWRENERMKIFILKIEKISESNTNKIYIYCYVTVAVWYMRKIFLFNFILLQFKFVCLCVVVFFICQDKFSKVCRLLL